MRKRDENINNGAFFDEHALIAYYNIMKKTAQEYVSELARHCRYKSIVSQTGDGTILDDRGRLMDLFDSCYVQDAHLQGVLQTLFAYLTGERYMLAKQDEKGRWIRDNEESKKVRGSQFEKILNGILEAKFWGYTGLEIKPDVDPETGYLKCVNSIERRNILADQHRIVQRQGGWDPGWDITAEQYKHNYVLVNPGDLGMFTAVVPLILAKKYVVANWVNFTHTYGQPIIHGKTSSEDHQSRKRLANDIASAAQNKVLVTGRDDEIDVKNFTMSNSEKLYESLKSHVNAEISNLILGSESMAGATQSYVGSTEAHEDIFRARIKHYRNYVENVMNEQVLPVLKYWGYIKEDVFFKYSNTVDMSITDKIKLYDMLTDKFEVSPETIDKEFDASVGKQFNMIQALSTAQDNDQYGLGEGSDRHIMSDEEYEKRYGHSRGRKNEESKPHEEDVPSSDDYDKKIGTQNRVNFLRGKQ